MPRPQEAVFVERNPGVYDLWINGRIADLSVTEVMIPDALRRARTPAEMPVFIEDSRGKLPLRPTRR